MKKAAKLYVIVVQCLIEIVVAAFGFYYLGYFLIGPDSIWNGILAVLGGLIGVGIFIKTMLMFEKRNEK